MTCVIHSCHSWLPLTETWLYRQIVELERAGVRSHVVCERRDNVGLYDKKDIHCLKNEHPFVYYVNGLARKWGIYRSNNYLRAKLNVFNADLLHSHFGHIGWANLSALHEMDRKHVVTFYGADVNFLPQQNIRWKKRYCDLFDHVSRVLCEGPHMAQCIEDLGCPPEKVIVHKLGIAFEDIPFVERNWNGNTPLKVLIAASFREKKGIPYAIEALARIQSEVPLSVTIIGDANREKRSQEERARIMKGLEESGLKDNVRLLGYVNHDRLMKECYDHHIFLSPSVTAIDGDTEGGCPVTLIEMMASGIMLLSTKHCDIPELISHKETGLLSAERDVAGIETNLHWLINNTAEWSKMARAGRVYVEQEYNARKQANKLKEIYDTVINAS